jgi:hypothetical protein
MAGRVITGEITAERVAEEFAEFGDDGVGDVVEGLEAVLAEGDEARFAEDAEVLGDVGLAHARGVDEFGDGFFAGEELVEEGEAALVGDGLEPGGNGAEGGG